MYYQSSWEVKEIINYITFNNQIILNIYYFMIPIINILSLLLFYIMLEFLSVRLPF